MAPSERRGADAIPPAFLIWAPPYTHRSSGVRALYRLCHHLNTAGFPAAMVAEKAETPPGWNTPFHQGPVDDSILLYPEIVRGNPLGAAKVIRWALNTPGLLGGDTSYSDEEMVFVYDPQRLAIVSHAVSKPLGKARILWLGLVDPFCIYPDPAVPKTIDCSFGHKGQKLQKRFPLPEEAGVLRLEDLTPDMAALGDTLRRTRTLYSYDHYSNLLREADICGCEVRVIDNSGWWHDPRSCDCVSNILWHPDLHETYAARFHDNAFVWAFVREVRTRWPVRQSTLRWRLRRLFRWV